MSEEEIEEKQYPVQEKVVFAGTTLIGMGLFDLLAHLGPTGLFVGGLASYVAWKHGPEIAEQVRGMFPSEEYQEDGQLYEPQKVQPKGRTFWDRALGIYPDDDGNEQEDIPPESDARIGRAIDEAKLRSLHKDCLFLGMLLWPHANDVLSSRITILGQPGAGKSNAVTVLCEELARYNAPLLVCDTKPEYGPLCERPYFTNPYRANAENVTPQTAYEFGQRLMDERLQVVLDLPSYKNDTTAAKVMIQILAGIWAWEASFVNDDRLPVTVVLEEAHIWLPQNPAMSRVSRVEGRDGSPSIFSQFQQSFFSLVTGGRSMGMGCVISTQRPADIDNRAIAGSEWRILLKTDLPGDLEVYRKLGMNPKLAPGLAKGEAYVRGPGGRADVYQLRKRDSPDEAKTPGLSALQRKRSTSVATSQPSSVPTSDATSDEMPQAQQDEVDRKSLRREPKESEVGVPLRHLSELERRVGELFFERQMKLTEIMRELYPDIKGGDAYQKATSEVQDAIRRYAAAVRHAAVQFARQEEEV